MEILYSTNDLPLNWHNINQLKHTDYKHDQFWTGQVIESEKVQREYLVFTAGLPNSTTLSIVVNEPPNYVHPWCHDSVICPSSNWCHSSETWQVY